MTTCEKCGELIEWFRECGWVHVYNTECLEFVYNEATMQIGRCTRQIGTK